MARLKRRTVRFVCAWWLPLFIAINVVAAFGYIWLVLTPIIGLFAIMAWPED